MTIFKAFYVFLIPIKENFRNYSQLYVTEPHYIWPRTRKRRIIFGPGAGPGNEYKIIRLRNTGKKCCRLFITDSSAIAAYSRGGVFETSWTRCGLQMGTQMGGRLSGEGALYCIFLLVKCSLW
jgi:hypothetical protein